MIYFEMNMSSQALGQRVAVNVLLPEKKVLDEQGTYKTLWLLHGLSDDHTIWLRRTSIERYAEEYGIAVIMPSTNRAWYTDTAYGANYFTFITKELPEFCRSYFKGMSDKREDNMVAGLSMGGYGAMKIALTCPEQYGYCASFSGALDVSRKGRVTDMKEWKSIFGYDIESPQELEGSIHDLYYLAKKDKAEEKPFPKMYLWCGTSDFLLEANRNYVQMLKEENIPHCYEESEGDHSWKWWDLHIQDALRYWFPQETN